jgi:hypothetical protein
MLIAYLTTDEVNQDLAMRMAEECGTTLALLSLRDGPPDGRFAAVLYDLDFLPPLQRQEVLGELLAGPSSHPVAVHSYNLEEDQVKALAENQVLVHRHLEPEVFQILCQAAGQARTAGCPTGVAPPEPASAAAIL